MKLAATQLYLGMCLEASMAHSLIDQSYVSPGVTLSVFRDIAERASQSATSVAEHCFDNRFANALQHIATTASVELLLSEEGTKCAWHPRGRANKSISGSWAPIGTEARRSLSILTP